MRLASLSRAALVGAVTLTSSMLHLGCAEERSPVSRVQAGALSKSFFVGELANPKDDPEFYQRTTVVDVAAGAGGEQLFTSSDAQPTTRVRFEIQEKLLIARLTYELVSDTDHKGARVSPDGQVVAAYAIEKHFDIRREYNAATGEESNLVVENDTDRPWYERAQFRVDWSKNLVTDAYSLDALSEIGLESGVKWDPVAYYVSDPKSDDAPMFDEGRGYFDVTNKALASPNVIHDPDWGDFPACWLVGQSPIENCNPSEITLRQSYLRVVDHDYEPVDWDGKRMDMFGWFTADRFGYDRRYGVVDQKWHRFATRWNLFEKSHASPVVQCATADTTPIGKSAHRDEDQNGTEDECEAIGRGSRCDEFRGECTTPMRDRSVRTIAWHVNPGFPEELFEGSAKALDAWSEAMRVAVIASRVAECRRTKDADCEAQMGWPSRWADDFSPPVGKGSSAEVPTIFVLCHNPVDPMKGDAAECGSAGTTARLGDLRFNFLNVIQEVQEQSPWGIMVDAEDPLTGEKVAGSVNQWGYVLDRAASSLVDILGLLNGEIDPESYIAGQTVADWVNANRSGGSASKATPMSAEELEARRNAFDPAVLEPVLAGIPKKLGGPAALRHAVRGHAIADAQRLGPGNAVLSERLRALRGKPMESALVSPEMAQSVGYDPSSPIAAEAVRRASPFGPHGVAMRRGRERAASLERAGRRSCRVDAPAPDTLLGLAKEAQKLFPLGDNPDALAIHEHQQKVYLWARQEFSRGVLAHELGHSVGLRHNFAGTFDSLNYRPEYWQLRTSDGSATADCPAGTKDGTSCIGPRYRDPISQAEIDGNINRYATTSVMDYPGDQNHDMLVAGKYDKAAMRFGYGGVVDLWGDPGLSVNGSGAAKKKAYALTAFGSHPGLFGVFYFPDPTAGTRFIHYSAYDREFGLISDCKPNSDPNAPLSTKCAEAAMDVADYRDMRDFAPDPDYANFSWGVTPRAIDGKGRVRRGYMFQSDEYSDIGNVTTFSYDAGADAYEQARFLEAGYEQRYLLDSFRRGRVQFNSWAVTSRVQAHYLDNLQNIAKTFAFGAVLDGDPTTPSDGFLDDGYYGPLEAGATVALDLFARIMTRPEPGFYCPSDVCGTGQPAGVNTPMFAADPAPLPEKYVYDFRVALGDGRFLHNDYDYSQGYNWGDYQTQVGTYYDKVWATYYLAEAFDNFISNSKEDFTDSRYKNVSFATVFPEQVRRLYGTLLTNDYQAYAPWVVVPSNPSDTPLGALEYPRWYAKEGPSSRPANASLVDPNYAWNEQIYAMVWGTIFFPTNRSQAWVHDARITLLPTEQPNWPADETIAFFNPETGLTYRAHAAGRESMLDAKHEKGTGARMLEWANHLVAEAYLVEVDGNGDPVVDHGDKRGTPVLKLDGNGKAQKNEQHPEAFAALQKYVDVIDTFRSLTASFEDPAVYGDLPQP